MSDVCVVIGAGPGIGAAVARRFAAEGMKVAVLARRPAELEKIAAEIRAQGCIAKGYPCDAERAPEIIDALSAVERDLGPIKSLVYNAAVVRPGNPLEVGAEQMVRELRVDLIGLLVAAQRVVPMMKEGGSILVTGGGLALDPWPQMTSLAVGKAAVRSLALSLHKQLAPVGIHAATVTVCGIVEKDTRFDPDAIARVFWELHMQRAGAFEAERVLR
jgi:NAD(P)-dependent dehydrogenase (short-subunit alcohol dehydrogenase family)